MEVYMIRATSELQVSSTGRSERSDLKNPMFPNEAYQAC